MKCWTVKYIDLNEPQHLKKNYNIHQGCVWLGDLGKVDLIEQIELFHFLKLSNSNLPKYTLVNSKFMKKLILIDFESHEFRLDNSMFFKKEIDKFKSSHMKLSDLRMSQVQNGSISDYEF